MNHMDTDEDKSASINCYFEERDGKPGLFVSAVELETGAHLTLWVPQSPQGIDATAQLVDNAPMIVHSALVDLMDNSDE